MKNILISADRGIFFISKFPRVSVHIAPWQKKIILFDFGIDLKDFSRGSATPSIHQVVQF